MVEPTAQDAVDGVALRRLLAVTTLTPVQAARLAIDLVDGLEELAGAERCPGSVSDRSVLVTADGRLVIPPATPDSDEAREPGAASASTLVRKVLGNASRRAPRSAAALRADKVTGSATELTELRRQVDAAVGDVVDATDDGWESRTRRQLAALVAATQGRRSQEQPGTEQPTTDQTQRLVPRAAFRPRMRPRIGRRRRWRSSQRLQPRKVMLIGLVVLLLAAVGWWGVPKAWAELQRGWEAVFSKEEPSKQLDPLRPPVTGQQAAAAPSKENSTTDAKPNKKPSEVPLPAPKQAGAVTGVTVERAEGACVPGKVCPVRVDVKLNPSGTPRTVSWSLRVFDRCSGDVVQRRGLSMSAEAGWRQVYGINRPVLPKGKALAVVAVTKSPARAASAPLRVPANDASC